MKYVLCLILITIMTNNVNANQILEAYSASEVLFLSVNFPSNSIIFIDIDDTIITPASKTFRTPGFSKLIDDLKRDKDKYQNYEQILSNWRLQRDVMLINENWPEVLSNLKDKFTVYGLTKMDVGKFGNIESMEKWRYLELKSMGIEFTNNNQISSNIVNNSLFYNGIFITGSNSKSQTIKNYLEVLKPAHIILIDDRKEHIEDLKQFCQKNSINFTGITFDGLKSFNERQDPKIFQLQKKYLIDHAKWIEDDQAAGMLDLK